MSFKCFRFMKPVCDFIFSTFKCFLFFFPKWKYIYLKIGVKKIIFTQYVVLPKHSINISCEIIHIILYIRWIDMSAENTILDSSILKRNFSLSLPFDSNVFLLNLIRNKKLFQYLKSYIPWTIEVILSIWILYYIPIH